MTGLEGNLRIVDEVSVKAIEELELYKEKVLVVISVGKKYIQEVEKNLELRGFRHYVNVSELAEEL